MSLPDYLAINAASVTNFGLMEATAGQLAISDHVTQMGKGQVKAAASGATVGLFGATITGGTVSTVKGSTLESGVANSEIDTTTPIKNAGTIETADGGNLLITGSVKNAGTGLLFAFDTTLTIAGTVTGGNTEIDGAGQIVLDGAASTKVTFEAGSTGQLVLDDPAAFKGTISGLSGPQNSFNDFFGFGDSTIDSGFFKTALADNLTSDETGNAQKNQLIENAVAAGGSGTPVGFGLMNSQILANDLGLAALPVDTPTGGTNYAIAGAVNDANADNGDIGNLNNNSTLPSTDQQIQAYLSANGGHADADALFLISSGGNDITYAKDNITGLGAQEAYLQNQIDDLASNLKTLQTDGAQHMLVLDNYGSGTLNDYYSTNLYSQLNTDGVNYIAGDIQSLVNYIKANPTDFGFTAATVLGGTVGSGNTNSAFDTQTGAGSTTSGWGQWAAPSTTPTANFAYLRAPNAEFTSLYSDNEHLSTIGQQIEASYELSLLYQAGLLSVDSVDLTDIPYSEPTSTSSPPPTTASFSGTATGGTLTVTDGAGHTAKLTLSGDYQGVSFATASDGHNGTVVFDPPASSDIQSELAGNPLSDGRYGSAVTTGTNLGMIDFTIARTSDCRAMALSPSRSIKTSSATAKRSS